METKHLTKHQIDLINYFLTLIQEEVYRAIKKFPDWPQDAIHAAAIVAEESGELVKACVEHAYEPEKNVTAYDVKKEAIQTACVAIRFLMEVNTYKTIKRY